VFGIFPERLYACIMQKMPAGDGAYSRTGKRTKRFVVDLYDRKLGKGSANRKWKGMNGKGGFDANFWKELGIVYANDDGIRDAWLDKFALTLGVRHKNVTSIKSQIQTTMVGGIRCLCIVHFLVLLSRSIVTQRFKPVLFLDCIDRSSIHIWLLARAANGCRLHSARRCA